MCDFVCLAERACDYAGQSQPKNVLRVFRIDKVVSVARVIGRQKPAIRMTCTIVRVRQEDA